MKVLEILSIIADIAFYISVIWYIRKGKNSHE